MLIVYNISTRLQITDVFTTDITREVSAASFAIRYTSGMPLNVPHTYIEPSPDLVGPCKPQIVYLNIP